MQEAMDARRAMALAVAALICLYSSILAIPGIDPGGAVAAFARSGVEEVADIPALRVSFEANAGQADEKVKFLARSSDSTLMLTSTAAVMTSTGDVPLRMTFAGADPETRITGISELRGRVNHLRGTEKNWVTDVPTYARVRYEQIYKGIDLDFYGHAGAFEYDFIVGAGADPRDIRLRFNGSGLNVDTAGELVVSVGERVVTQSRPVLYQDVDGVRRQVEGSFRILDGRTIGFDVGRYDRARPLVIDPKVEFSMLIGGEGIETGQGLVVDDEGYVYVGGETESADLGAHGGSDSTFNGAIDAFVAKIDPSTLELIWMTYLGGTSWDAVHRQNGLALDPDGNVYAGGFTFSPDFPTSDNAHRKNLEGRGQEAFVTKFTPSGEVVYSTLIGGATGGLDGGRALAVDAEGRAYVTGTMGADDMETRRPVQERPLGGQDAYLAVLEPDGSDLYFATYLGGTDNVQPDEVRQGRVGVIEDGQSLALGPDGLAWVMGVTDATDFPTTPDAFRRKNPGGRSYFLSAIDVHAGTLVYSTYIGGPGEEGALSFQSAGVALDQWGNTYVTGNTRMTAEQAKEFPIKNAYDASYNGGWDFFVMKFHNHRDLVYSTFLGSKQDDVVNSIAVDQSQALHVVGKTLEAPTPPTDPKEGFLEGRAGEPVEARGGGADGFIVKLGPCGNTVDFWSFIGGSSALDRTPAQGTLASEETALVVTLDDAGDAYVAGLASSKDFRPAPSDGSSLHGPWDAFLVKFTDERNHPPAQGQGPAGSAPTCASAATKNIPAAAQ